MGGGVDQHAAGIGYRDPSEIGIRDAQALEYFGGRSFSLHGTDGLETRTGRLTQVRSQLIRFKGEPAHVLLHDNLARNIARPQGCCNGETRRQCNHQPDDAGN